jgi:hypothetical protein
MRSAAYTNSLDQLINKEIRLNNNLYKLQIEVQAYKLKYVLKKKEN